MQKNSKKTQPNWLGSFFRQAVSIAVVLALNSTAWAQEVIYIEEGKPAPFTGMLMTTARAAQLQAEVEGCDDWVDREHNMMAATASVTIAHEKRMCSIEKHAQQRVIDAYRDQVKKSDSIWNSRELWFGFGALAGALSIVLGAWAIHEVAN